MTFKGNYLAGLIGSFRQIKPARWSAMSKRVSSVAAGSRHTDRWAKPSMLIAMR